MWITGMLVEKLNSEDKKIDNRISEGTISDKELVRKSTAIGLLEGIVDGCLIIGAIELIRGTIRLITRK